MRSRVTCPGVSAHNIGCAVVNVVTSTAMVNGHHSF